MGALEPITIKTKDAAGKESGSVTIDESALGGFVKHKLAHAASVMYHANARQGTACAKTRAEVAGSRKKLYKQKGTGRARAGNRQSGKRVGGGVIHPPKPRKYSFTMPQKQRAAAVRTIVLGKAKDGELHVVTKLAFDAPKTKGMIALLKALNLTGQTVLVATDGLQKNTFLAGRNLPGVKVLPGAELTARELLVHKHLVCEQAVLERLNKKPEHVLRSRKPRGTRKADRAAKKVEA
jgi:large subunit ribosomal protein L4